ncbi:MAG TPA: hypothetical protein VFV50_16590, partial [Bdellovibrionales bacterium]|nr:hypothetical protein [Bdellovibrionales bacterium]
LLEGRPKTSLFRRAFPESDSQGRSSRALLSKLYDRVRGRVEGSYHQVQNLKTCLPRVSDPKCSEIQDWLRKDLPEFVKAVRFHLSLAQSPAQAATKAGRASNIPNFSMRPLGSFKLVSWVPMHDRETARAHESLNRYRDDIHNESTRRVQSGELKPDEVADFKSESLLAIRYQHYLTYFNLLSELPLLQYLKGPGATPAQVATALGQMERNLSAERAELDRLKALLDKPGPLDRSVMDLLDYNSALEEVLLEDNQYCGLAASLKYTSSNRMLGSAILTAGPILAASFFAPPIAAIGLGVAAGGVHAHRSYQDYKLSERRLVSHIYGDGIGSELRDAEAARRIKNLSVITLPVGFGLAGTAVRALKASPGAVAFGLRLFETVP